MNPVHRLGARTVATLAAVFTAGGLAACQPETSGPDVGVSVREIQNDFTGGEESDQFYAGRDVTVSADINRILGPHAFSIAGTQSGVEPLLIVHPSELGKGQLNEGSPIKVSGTVRSGFDTARVEREVEYEFDRDVFTDYSGDPYIVATKIETAL